MDYETRGNFYLQLELPIPVYKLYLGKNRF